MKPHSTIRPRLSCFVTAMRALLSAADPVFPPGSPGRHDAAGRPQPAPRSFVGFETEDQSVKVLVTELPAEAYGEVTNAFKANPAGTGGIKPRASRPPAGLAYYTAENAKDGATTVRRYSMILPGGTFSGYVAVQVPENATKIYSDDACAADVRPAAIRQRGSGRGAALTDAVQDQRARAISRISARWRSGAAHYSRRRRRDRPASSRHPSW